MMWLPESEKTCFAPACASARATRSAPRIEAMPVMISHRRKSERRQSVQCRAFDERRGRARGCRDASAVVPVRIEADCVRAEEVVARARDEKHALGRERQRLERNPIRMRV